MGTDELDQFELLEQRVEALISMVNSLKEENAALERRVQEGGEEFRSLKKETEGLMAGREAVRERIARLLRKIEECA
jgi:FtsZ-binding cell division protein ZapB